MINFKTPGLAPFLALAACSAIGSATAYVVRVTPADGQNIGQQAYKTEYCYPNFESGTNKVKSFYKFSCTSPGAGGTITKTHYDSCTCQNQICSDSVSEGALHGAGSERVEVTCTSETPTTVAMGIVSEYNSACDPSKLDNGASSNNGCGLSMETQPNVVNVCMKGRNYWSTTTGQVQSSTGYTKLIGDSTTHTAELKYYTNDGCTDNEVVLETYTYATHDGANAGGRFNACVPFNSNNIPQCNAGGNGASFFYTIQSDAACKGGFEMSTSPYVCASASSSASSLVASSLAALLAVAAAPLFL